MSMWYPVHGVNETITVFIKIEALHILSMYGFNIWLQVTSVFSFTEEHVGVTVMNLKVLQKVNDQLN